MTISMLGYTAVEFPCEEVVGGEGRYVHDTVDGWNPAGQLGDVSETL